MGRTDNNSEGSLPWAGRGSRAADLYSVDPTRIGTMMQSCASAAKLRGNGPILRSGSVAIVKRGSPPPRIVIGRARWVCLSGRVLFLPRSHVSRRPHDDALRRLTRGHKKPQRNQQLSRQRHDHCLARDTAFIGRSRLEPLRESAVFLEEEKSLCQLDHATAHTSATGAGQSLLAATPAALVGCSREAGVASDGAPIPQVAG